MPELRYSSHALYDGIPAPLSTVDTSKIQYILYDRLTANVDRECAAGSTLWGIHKDDVSLMINGREAKLYASQGQQDVYKRQLFTYDFEMIVSDTQTNARGARERDAEYRIY